MTDAERIIARFGGIRPMAARLGIAVTTVQGWKQRGVIPLNRHDQIVEAAAAAEIDLSGTVLGGEPNETTLEGRAEEVEPTETTPPEREAEPLPARSIIPDAKPSEVAAADETPWDEAPKDETPEDQIPEEGAPEGEPDPIPDDIRSAMDETPEETPPPPPAREPRPSGTRAGFVGGLFAAAIVAGAGYAAMQTGLIGAGPAAEALEARLKLAERRAAAATVAARGAEARSAESLRKLQTLEARAAAAEKGATTAIDVTRQAMARMEAAQKQIAALSGALSRIEAAEKGATAASKAAADATAGLEALREELKNLKTGSDAAALGDALAELRGQVKAMGEKLAALSPEALQTASAGNKAIAEVREQLTKLGKTLEAEAATLGTRLEALKERLSGSDERLKTLETRTTQTASMGGRDAAVIAAIGQLREAVQAGRPFGQELAAVKTLTGAASAWATSLSALDAKAQQGVASLGALRSRFPKAAVAIIRAARVPENGDWLDRAWARAKTVVVIRRTGPGVEGETPEAIVARAEARLADSDLKGAAQVLAKLNGNGAKAASAWLGVAKARLTALDAVAALQRTALGRIAGVPAKSGKTPEAPKPGSATQ